MNFDYNGLISHVGKKIGEWEGYPVYICSKKNILKMSYHTMYILYDDNNTIVCNKGNGFFVYGKVDREGNVTKVSPKRYLAVEVEYNAKAEKKEKPVVSEFIDIDKYLRDMNNLTIEQMLEGIRGEL